MIIRATIDYLAHALGVESGVAEEVLRSEASAREQVRLSRRGLFLGAGAVAAGRAFSFAPLDDERMIRMVMVAAKEYTDWLPIQSYGVEAVRLDPASRRLEVRVWVRPLGYIVGPIKADLGFK